MSEMNLHKRKATAKNKDGDGEKQKLFEPEINDVKGQVWEMNEKNACEITKKQNEIGKRVFRKALKRFCFMVIALVTIYVYKMFTADPIPVFASAQNQIVNLPLSKRVPCFFDDYAQDAKAFPNCVPTKCGRMVLDSLVTAQETNHLLSIAKKAFELTGANGSSSILDLHSGALSSGDVYLNMYMLIKGRKGVFTTTDFDVYRNVQVKIQQFIVKTFGIAPGELHLTQPAFFSKLTANAPSKLGDEYWHLHVDKHTYGSFHYTALLYLNTYFQEFSGGRFMFIDANGNSTIEPRAGRVSVFTSGKENSHLVERVIKGTRFALTIPFTCDPAKANKDRELRQSQHL